MSSLFEDAKIYYLKQNGSFPVILRGTKCQSNLKDGEHLKGVDKSSEEMLLIFRVVMSITS